jgi:hemolysin D
VRQWKDLLQHYLDVFRDAWRERKGESTRHVDDREFLPAALALVETPPARLSRPVLLATGGFVIAALLWACFGHIDIIVTATGKVLPNGNVKTVQPLRDAVVQKILVRDGDHVKAGQLLIELDATTSNAELGKARVEYFSTELERERIRLLLAAETSGRAKPDTLRAPVADVPGDLLEEQNRLMQVEYAEFISHITAARAEITRLKAGRATTQAMLDRLLALQPFQKQKTEDMRRLSDKAYISRHALQDEEQQLVSTEEEIRVQRRKLDEVSSVIAKQEQQEDVLRREFRLQYQEKLADAKQRSDAMSEEMRRLAGNQSLTELRAPVDGVVQQLSTHTIGGVVTAAQPVLVIVPRDAKLEIEAIIENKDIGFVDVSMPAQVKVDAFPFTRYGTIGASVTHMSLDAVPDEKRGLVYQARIALKQATMNIDGKIIPLSPGMTVRAEIRTGQRRLIEYFVSPLLQYKDEALRER